jgi:tetratricopeptide (TPR) repeat protein
MSERELLEQANQAMRQMRFEDTIKVLDKLLEREPSNAEVLYLKGQAVANLGNLQEAFKMYTQALKLSGHDLNRAADILIDMGNVLLEVNHLDEADDCYDRALRIKPKLARVWVEKSRVAARRKKFKDSVSCCDKAISIDSGDPRAWNNKAFALFQLKRVDECIECARRAISLKPDYTTAWNWLGHAYKSKGDPQRAEDCFKKVQEYGQRGMFFETRRHVHVNTDEH